MKKLFTLDDLMIALVAAVGYGFGERIPRLFGCPEPLCLVICLIAGAAVETILYKIVFSEAVQTNPSKRIPIFAACILFFLVANYISYAWLGSTLFGALLEEFAFVIGLPILSFVVVLLIRLHRIRKVREQYGDGSEGYVFDVKNEDIDDLNQQNQPIQGDYDTDCAAKTRTGIFVGEKQGKTISYVGIPYAKPPVGELRWKAPEPLPPSDAVFEAKHFGASAIQVGHEGLVLKNHRQSEDCLSLNICIGSKREESKKPVLVLFHHGDFSYGGAVDPLLYGDGFVGNHPDVIFASFNYRLGVFGFIDFSEVPGGEAYPDALNLGLLDQVAALKWIKENIAAFGGDPDRITVIGFESGAISICLLAASERAKGLFQKAFVFFGSPDFAPDTPDASRDLARNLLKETQTTTMEELLQLDTESLQEASQKLWLKLCGPTCGETGIPADVSRAYCDGAASGIDFIFGIPSDELGVFRSFVGERNFEDFVRERIAEMKSSVDGPLADALQEYIETLAASSTELEAKSKVVEQWASLSIYQNAAKLSTCGNNVHLMYWNEKPLIENLGSGTVDVAAVLLGNVKASQMYGNVIDEDVSEVLQVLLQKFINGDALRLYPNEIKKVDAIDWEAFPQALVVSGREIRWTEFQNEDALWSAMQEKQ